MTASFTAPIVVESLADLAQVHMADFEWGTTAWVKTVPFGTDGGLYVLLKSTALITNGTTVITAIVGSPIAGNAGARWVFVTQPAAGPTSADGFVFVRPIDGVTDDAPLLNAIFTLNAGKNVVVMAPGLAGEEFQILSQQNLPSGATIWGVSGAVIHVNLPGASVLNSALAAIGSQGAPIAITINNTPGTAVIQTAASPGAAGDWMLLALNPLYSALYRIVSVVAAGPNFNVTVDRAIVYQATAGTSTVSAAVPKENIQIVGGGMRIHGTAGGAYVTALIASGCSFSDLRLDGTDTGPVASFQDGILFDNTCLGCSVSDMTITGASGAVANQVGAQIIGENLSFFRTTTSHCVTGITVNDALGISLRDFESYANVNGLVVTSDNGAAFYPSEANVLSDGLIYGNSGDGIVVAQGALFTVFRGISSLFNGGSGAVMSAVTSPPKSTHFIGCEFRGNLVGVQDVAGAKDTMLCDCDITGNVQSGLIVNAQVFAKNLVSRTGNPTAVVNVNAGEAWIDGYDFTLSQVASQVFQVSNAAILYADRGRLTLSAAGVGFQLNGTSRSFIKGVRFTVDANCQLVLLNGAAGLVCCLEDADCDGTALGGSVGVNVAANCTIRLGERVKFDALANPFNFNAGSLWSRSIDGHGNYPAGTNILVAGAPIVVAWPDIGRSDRVELVRTAAAPPAAGIVMPTVTKIVGTSFTITPDALDAGTYAYCIH